MNRSDTKIVQYKYVTQTTIKPHRSHFRNGEGEPYLSERGRLFSTQIVDGLNPSVVFFRNKLSPYMSEVKVVYELNASEE